MQVNTEERGGEGGEVGLRPGKPKYTASVCLAEVHFE